MITDNEMEELIEMRKETLNHYGIKLQIEKTFEEMEEVKAELLKENVDKKLLQEEISDLYNMLDQIETYFNLDYDEMEEIMYSKMKRTIKRIKEGK